MPNDTLSLRALDVLFQLASGDTPATAIRLAQRLEITPDAARAALGALEKRGLVDASRCRLTFPGLAIAASRRANVIASPVRAAA